MPRSTLRAQQARVALLGVEPVPVVLVAPEKVARVVLVVEDPLPVADPAVAVGAESRHALPARRGLAPAIGDQAQVAAAVAAVEVLAVLNAVLVGPPDVAAFPGSVLHLGIAVVASALRLLDLVPT